MGHGVFITGTDTGVGKTRVASMLLRAMAARGRRVTGMKPVLTGAGDARNDATLLREASNVAASLALINPYAFVPAIAPHVAAQRAGAALELERIEAAYRSLADVSDIVVVEGAGGVLVPLNTRHDMLDIAVRLDLPVILVVGVRLGCINHALLSVLAIRARGLRLAGWIANHIDPAMAEADASIDTLARSIPAALLATIRWGDTALSVASEQWRAAGCV